MAAISITVKDSTPELFQKLEKAVGRFVRKGAVYIEGQLKTSMAEPKTGRAYPRGKDGVHIASAPGESPADDSSNLAVSIQTLMKSTLEAKIGTPVEYALYLEDGTRAPSLRSKPRQGRMAGPVENLMGPHRGGMAPRPLWERTAKESLPTLEKMLEAEIRGV